MCCGSLVAPRRANFWGVVPRVYVGGTSFTACARAMVLVLTGSG